MKWEGMIPHRAMPWYFFVHRMEDAAGYYGLKEGEKHYGK